MKYLIVQEWNSTRGNHAGMRHMCDLLVNRYPSEYKVLVREKSVNIHFSALGAMRLLQKLWRKLYWEAYAIPKEYRQICSEMFKSLNDDDQVFLLEYLLKQEPQKDLAYYIRRCYPNVKIHGLIHLTPSLLRQQLNEKEIQQWCLPLDKVMTLGSSLSSFLIEMGISPNIISTGFHYVDNSYYKNDITRLRTRPIRIITMGALQRNYNLISEVVKQCSDMEWIICRGRNKDVDSLFPQSSNIKLLGYLSEDELKNEMMSSDVSLNIMDDTVGSNVITTSMSMGLAMVVTDVGSIRDYCNESNSVFCNGNVESIKEALLSLEKRDLVEMKNNSIKLSERLSIDNVHFWFCSL